MKNKEKEDLVLTEIDLDKYETTDLVELANSLFSVIADRIDDLESDDNDDTVDRENGIAVINQKKLIDNYGDTNDEDDKDDADDTDDEKDDDEEDEEDKEDINESKGGIIADIGRKLLYKSPKNVSKIKVNPKSTSVVKSFLKTTKNVNGNEVKYIISDLESLATKSKPQNAKVIKQLTDAIKAGDKTLIPSELISGSSTLNKPLRLSVLRSFEKSLKHEHAVFGSAKTGVPFLRDVKGLINSLSPSKKQQLSKFAKSFMKTSEYMAIKSAHGAKAAYRWAVHSSLVKMGLLSAAGIGGGIYLKDKFFGNDSNDGVNGVNGAKDEKDGISSDEYNVSSHFTVPEKKSTDIDFGPSMDDLLNTVDKKQIDTSDTKQIDNVAKDQTQTSKTTDYGELGNSFSNIGTSFRNAGRKIGDSIGSTIIKPFK